MQESGQELCRVQERGQECSPEYKKEGGNGRVQERDGSGAGCKKGAEVVSGAKKGRKWCRCKKGRKCCRMQERGGSGVGYKKGAEVVRVQEKGGSVSVANRRKWCRMQESGQKLYRVQESGQKLCRVQESGQE